MPEEERMSVEIINKKLGGDPNLPATAAETKEEIAPKDDSRFSKHFQMLKVGMLQDAVKHSMTTDDRHNPSILDDDPNSLTMILTKSSESSKAASKKKLRRLDKVKSLSLIECAPGTKIRTIFIFIFKKKLRHVHLC